MLRLPLNGSQSESSLDPSFSSDSSRCGCLSLLPYPAYSVEMPALNTQSVMYWREMNLTLMRPDEKPGASRRLLHSFLKSPSTLSGGIMKGARPSGLANDSSLSADTKPAPQLGQVSETVRLPVFISAPQAGQRTDFSLSS